MSYDSSFGTCDQCGETDCECEEQEEERCCPYCGQDGCDCDLL